MFRSSTIPAPEVLLQVSCSEAENLRLSVPCDVCAAGKNPSGSHGPTQKLLGGCTMEREIRKLWIRETSAGLLLSALEEAVLYVRTQGPKLTRTLDI